MYKVPSSWEKANKTMLKLNKEENIYCLPFPRVVICLKWQRVNKALFPKSVWPWLVGFSFFLIFQKLPPHTDFSRYHHKGCHLAHFIFKIKREEGRGRGGGIGQDGAEQHFNGLVSGILTLNCYFCTLVN